jgi:hypothetical protein
MTRQKKNKVRVEKRPQKGNPNEVRKHGIEALEKEGTRVFMTKLSDDEKEIDINRTKWHIRHQPTTLQKNKDKLLVEIGRGFEVEMWNERPERDEGGRKKIKPRKVGLT